MNATYQILMVDRCYVVEFPKETTGHLTAQAQRAARVVRRLYPHPGSNA